MHMRTRSRSVSIGCMMIMDAAWDNLELAADLVWSVGERRESGFEGAAQRAARRREGVVGDGHGGGRLENGPQEGGTGPAAG